MFIIIGKLLLRVWQTLINTNKSAWQAMVRGEFERELEEYIAQRRRAKIKFPNIFAQLKRPKKMPEPEFPPEIRQYEEGSPAEPVEVMPGEEEAQSKGIVTKILETLGIVTVEQRSEEIPQEQVQQMLAKDEINQDMKEIAKIALHVIKQLPSEELASFKSSPEFGRLKELLKKHQLIK